jgi:hypothetical protein
MLSSFRRSVVQRQSAASRSATPCRSGQHLALASCPMTRWMSPPSTSTHAFSFSVSIGHVFPAGGGDGYGGVYGGT